MKKRFLIVLSALLVFGLCAAVYAFQADNQNAATNCPMHKQNATASAGEHKDSCCGMADCCKDGKCSMGGACCKDKDSCPMKQNPKAKTQNEMDVSKIIFAGGESCCADGAACCNGGACCKKHKNS